MIITIPGPGFYTYHLPTIVGVVAQLFSVFNRRVSFHAYERIYIHETERTLVVKALR